jgi:hypothetical protein
MTKLPRRIGGMSRIGAAPLAPPHAPRPPGAAQARNGADDLTVEGADPDRRSRSSDTFPSEWAGIPVAAAIEAALAAPGVDAVTRVHLDSARVSLTARRTGADESLNAPTLSEALFAFVMPRLKHPEVLAVERQFVLLEQLAEELGGQNGDTVVREGALAVHRELRRLALLRQHCSNLVEG